MDTLNLAASSGSTEIIMSLFSAISWFRYSTCSLTHSLKSSPITAADIFAIHCFGIFGMSGSSGKNLSMPYCWTAKARIFWTVRFSYCGIWMVYISLLVKYAFFLPIMSLRKYIVTFSKERLRSRTRGPGTYHTVVGTRCNQLQGTYNIPAWTGTSQQTL